MSNFGKVHHRNGSFLADDICLYCTETIKVVGEEGTVNGLQFTVFNEEARISDQWRRGELQTGHFHVVSLHNGSRFPLSGFVLELLHDYGIAPS